MRAAARAPTPTRQEGKYGRRQGARQRARTVKIWCLAEGPPAGVPGIPIPAVRTEVGSGEPCAACEEPIAAGEPLEACEYPSGRTLHFHGWCYKAWNDERAAL